MMKRAICIILAALIAFSLFGCTTGSITPSAATQFPTDAPAATVAPVPTAPAVAETSAPAQETAEPALTAKPASTDACPLPTESEEEPDEDVTWDGLMALGNVQFENGQMYVLLTMPADFVEEGTTQEKLDANAGKTYTSAELNEDGSVTYKLNQEQHKAMLASLTQNIEAGLQEMVDDPDCSYEKITHNADFTVFDVYLSKDEMGFSETFGVLAFYLYGGMYSIFTGHTGEDITVNHYASSGELIDTAHSAALGG